MDEGEEQEAFPLKNFLRAPTVRVTRKWKEDRQTDNGPARQG